MSSPEIVIDRATEAQIADFLREHSIDFSPPLEQALDIPTYARKLRQNARTYEIWDGHRLDALMAVYFNEELGQLFVSHICTARARWGKGLGSLFMKQLKSYGEPYRFIRLEVRRSNERARAFYVRQGFQVEAETEERLTLVCPLPALQPETFAPSHPLPR